MSEREYPFRFAERCLYEYQSNVARLEHLRARLAALYASSTAGVQSWEEQCGNGAAGDPVAVRQLKILTLEEEIGKLAQRTEPITRLKTDLEAPYVLEGSPKFELARVMKLYYFGGNDRGQVAGKLGMEPRTLYRRRVELVRMAQYYMGL